MISLLLLWSGPVLANGQTTHLWISATAIGHLEDQDLSDLLHDNRASLAAGTMFPDGGYAIGHPYAEAAHWEPFQDLFRQWILDNFEGPEDPLAATHIAFYLGLASHGMADQVFDSMYMERSRIYDAEFGWADETASLDISHDVVFANLTSAQEPPEPLIPTILPSIFSDLGIDVDMDTLYEGQGWLDVAVSGVAAMSTVPSVVAMHTETFPWGCSHLLDASVPGAPPHEARVVAKYWESLWADLNDQKRDLEVIGWWPPEGTMGHPQSGDDIEAQLSIIFNRSLWNEAVTGNHFRVQSSGRIIQVEPVLFYRDFSHIVNISPTSSWGTDADHQLKVHDLSATDGRLMTDPFILHFSTRNGVDATPTDIPSGDSKSSASGCAHTLSAASLWLWFSALLGIRGRRTQPTSPP